MLPIDGIYSTKSQTLEKWNRNNNKHYAASIFIADNSRPTTVNRYLISSLSFRDKIYIIIIIIIIITVIVLIVVVVVVVICTKYVYANIIYDTHLSI